MSSSTQVSVDLSCYRFQKKAGKMYRRYNQNSQTFTYLFKNSHIQTYKRDISQNWIDASIWQIRFDEETTQQQVTSFAPILDKAE